jgi:hypothetical protein
MRKHVATGFEFVPLTDGNVLIEFYGDDGEMLNCQVIAGDRLGMISCLAHITQVAMSNGVEAAKKILDAMIAEEEPDDHDPQRS